MYNKENYTREDIKVLLIKLSKLDGYEKPSTYLNEKLEQVKTFNDRDFTMDFILKVHSICNEIQKEFWSESHKKDITQWLFDNCFFMANKTISAEFVNGRIVTKDVPLFSTTWDAPEPTPKPESQKSKVQKLTLRQIALKSYYENKSITEQNSNEIAKNNGHNSGHKLLLHYNFFCSNANRKASSKTQKIKENNIKFFERVIELLSETFKERAKNELEIIRNLPIQN